MYIYCNTLSDCLYTVAKYYICMYIVHFILSACFYYAANDCIYLVPFCCWWLLLSMILLTSVWAANFIGSKLLNDRITSFIQLPLTLTVCTCRKYRENIKLKFLHNLTADSDYAFCLSWWIMESYYSSHFSIVASLWIELYIVVYWLLKHLAS